MTIPDSLDSSGGTIGQFDRVGTRYLVFARTPDGTLLWSAEPKPTSTAPYFHTLGASGATGPYQIRMTAVDSSVRAQVDSFFPKLEKPPGPNRPGVTPGNDKIPKSRWLHSNLGLAVVGILAAILGALIGRSKLMPGPQRSHGGSGGHRRSDAQWEEQIRKVVDARLATLERHITDTATATGKDVLLIPAKVVEQLGPSLESFLEQALKRKEEQHIQPPVVPVRQKGPSPQRSVADEVGGAFVEWCHTAGGNVHRITDFSETLRSRVMGAGVRVLTRDRDDNGITFVFDNAGDPVEYWMVTIGAETMLLPRPLNQESFKELHPVYEGSADPRSLRSIEPAFVRQDGASWVLQSPGRVS
jgi:hypothetical protein